MKPGDFAKPYRVTNGKKFRLKDYDPGDSGPLESKERAVDLLRKGVERLAELQDRLYAQDRWALLLVFQAMDAAGKDGTIKHVMSGLNPQGCQVYSFKSPSSEELDHDYMWRTSKALPERGRIGVFNRSYYEEVLVVRVHSEFLAAQKLPPAVIGKDIWKQRYEDINSFERYVTRNGIAIRKFFLNVSRKEQKKRFMARLDLPDKNWKFSSADARERQHWDDYMEAYEDAIRNTASDHAPWFVVPANKKWFCRIVVAAAVIEALEDMNLQYPKVDEKQRKELEVARALLEAEGRDTKGKKDESDDEERDQTA
jgi:PPK2 family polyphosphate:nucleotide phosphotransferase